MTREFAIPVVPSGLLQTIISNGGLVNSTNHGIFWNRNYNVVAHELGHYLLGEGHSEEHQNLMKEGVKNIGKRLTLDQCTRARKTAKLIAERHAAGGEHPYDIFRDFPKRPSGSIGSGRR